MTPQAVEAPPVAHRASRLIRIELAACVSIQEIGRVAGRLQLSALHVAELATVRWIDLVMAHQAIRHLRQSAPIRPDRSGLPQMADWLVCHNQVDPPYSCEFCHVKAAQLKPASHTPDFLDTHTSGKLDLDKTTCAVC